MPAEQSHKLWLHAFRKRAWFLDRLSDGWMSGLLAWSLVFSVLQPGVCEDRITYRSANGEETRVRVGSLSQYIDGEIQFQVREGGLLKIPSARVVQLEFESGEAWKKGLEFWHDGNWDEAFDLLVKAYRNEERDWAKYEIQSVILRCAYALEKYEIACDVFLQMMEDDPGTRHFHWIPLSWQRGDDDPTLIRQAERWMQSSNSLEQLLGASWLLTTAKQSQAIDVLTGVVESGKQPFADLARTQIWRPRVPRADRDRVNLWRQAIAEMPIELRSGPNWLIAQAASRLESHDLAAINYLKVAVDENAHEALRAEALLGAARQLQDEHPRESAETLKELKKRFSQSNAWQLGQQLGK